MNLSTLTIEELKALKEDIDLEIKKRAKSKKDDVSMDLAEFVAWTKKSKQRHIQLIGSWAETINVKYKTKAQWDVFIKRNLRPAKLLEPFNDQQILDAFEEIENTKWISHKTLETILKFLK